MDTLLQDIIGLLVAYGPWIVFAVAFTETAFFAGLLVPAEATVLVAAFLADRGVFGVGEVLAAALFGGLAGDQIGYLLGRFGGTRIAAREGRIGRLWRRYEPVAEGLFGRHAALAVTVARFVSFVRTLMPWFAGMVPMPYLHFLAFDVLGVLGWAAGSVALGYLAGESWHLVAEALGTAGAVVLIAGGLLALYVVRRRRRAALRPPAEAAPVSLVPGHE